MKDKIPVQVFHESLKSSSSKLLEYRYYDSEIVSLDFTIIIFNNFLCSYSYFNACRWVVILKFKLPETQLSKVQKICDIRKSVKIL